MDERNGWLLMSNFYGDTRPIDAALQLCVARPLLTRLLC